MITHTTTMACLMNNSSMTLINSSCVSNSSRHYVIDTSDITNILLVLYGLICVVGIIGNGMVICVVLKYPKMRTVTNMYLLNLSIADSIFLLGLPMVITTTLVKHWIYGAVLCKVYYISTGVNMFTGTFTLTVMSADRFIAVCYPIKSMHWRTPRHALVIIMFTWISSFLVIVPIMLYARVIPSPNDPSLHSCKMQWPPGEKAYICYTLSLGFVIPVLLISLFYALLVIKLRSNAQTSKSRHKKRSHRKVTRLVSLVIAIYIVCWLPYWAFQLHLVIPEKLSGSHMMIMMFQVRIYVHWFNSFVMDNTSVCV